MMRIIKGANDVIWNHAKGTIYVLHRGRDGTVGIQEYSDGQGKTRYDVVFVAGAKNNAGIVCRGIIGGFLSHPMVFWTNRKGGRIETVHTVFEAKLAFRHCKIPLEILEIAVSNFKTNFPWV
jgi:hypothetical protein